MDLKIQKLFRYHKRTQLALLSVGVFALFVSILVVNLAANSDQLRNMFASAEVQGTCRGSLSGVNSCMFGEGRGFRIYNMSSSGIGCNYRGNPPSLYFLPRDLAPGSSVCQSKSEFVKKLRDERSNWKNCCNNWDDLIGNQPPGQPRPTNSSPTGNPPPTVSCKIQYTVNQFTKGTCRRPKANALSYKCKKGSSIKSETVTSEICLSQDELILLANNQCCGQRGSVQGERQITNWPLVPSPTTIKRSCNETCSVDSDCLTGYRCYYRGSSYPILYANVCRRIGCETNEACSTCTTPPPTTIKRSCNETCSVDSDCLTGYRCYYRGSSYPILYANVCRRIGCETNEACSTCQKDSLCTDIRCTSSTTCNTYRQGPDGQTPAQQICRLDSERGGTQKYCCVIPDYQNPTPTSSQPGIPTGCTTERNSYCPCRAGEASNCLTVECESGKSCAKHSGRWYCCPGGSGSSGYGTTGGSSSISCGFWPCPTAYQCVNSYCVVNNSY